MRQEQIDIIMFNMSSYSDWTKGIHNRNYHILHALHRDPRIRKIVGVDFLPFNIKQGAKVYINDIIKNSHGGKIVYGDLTSECHQVSSKLYVYSTIDSLFNFGIVNHELKRIQKVLNLHNIVSWSCNPLFTKHYYKINEKLNVFDTVDNWLEHNDLAKFKNRMGENYKYISENADLIFTVSKNLEYFYQDMNRKENVYHINNGIDTQFFNKDSVMNSKPIDFYEKIKANGKKTIGYIGSMQANRIDIDLLASIAKSHKDKNIILAGPVWPKVKKIFDAKLKNFDNVYYPGRIHRMDWINVAAYFDVAINPHAVNEFNKYTNPTKIYEYLACGLPVVSTKVAGVEYFGDDIYLAKNNKEFNLLITKALGEDSDIKCHIRIEKALKEYSWSSRVESMIDLILKHPKMLT